MPANPITTYDSPQGTGANREDLEDIAYDISPERTPLFTMGAKKGKPKGINHDWLTDELGAPSGTGVIEAKVTTNVSPNPPVRLSNTTQINERPVTISGSQTSVDSADGWGHVDRETARRVSELKRDIETRLCSMQPLVAGDESGPVARQTRSPMHFVRQATAQGYTVSASPTAAVGAFDVGAVFDEDALDAVMKKCFDIGGMPTKFVVSSGNKTAVAAFTGRVNEVLNVSETRVTRDVTVIQTPHGKVEVVVDQFFPAGATQGDFSFVADPEMYGTMFLRKIGKEKLGKVGDLESWLVNCEWTAWVGNPGAHGVLAYDSVP